MRFPVLDRSDAEGLGRDDPGAVFPQKVGEYKNVGDGAEVVLVGRRSTQWYSGADEHPPSLLPGTPHAGGRVGEVIDGVRLGQEPGVEEIVALFEARGPRGSRRGGPGRRAARRRGGRRGHLGQQPQHQLHQRLHLQMPVLRVLERARSP